MFKTLKKKLEQGVNQSPLRGALASASKFLDDKEPDGNPVAESTPKKTEHQAAGDAGNQSLESNTSNYATANQSFNDSLSMENQSSAGGAAIEVPVGQLVDIPLQDTSSESSSTYIPGDVTPQASRSRTSSISSVTSDGSFFTNMSFPHHSYSLPSDMESEMDESGTDLHTVSKEDLYHYIQKYQRRATRYKSKFLEIVAVYKDMAVERDKFKNTLTQSQDRAFRRISELKEQIHLDAKAKLDVEENYNLVIDEKGEFIKVLQTQVRLLKEGKEIPPELEERILAGKAKTIEENTKSDEMSAEISSLKDKVKHQEGLLHRCKEIIRSNKEKHTRLAEENDSVQKQYEDIQKDLARLKGASSPDTVTKLTNQIKQARGVIEQLETDRQLAIAEVKQQVHEEMGRKDVELAEARSIALTLTDENAESKEKAEKMEKTAADQLEKSREIIRKLKEDRHQTMVAMEEKLKEAEEDMENEKSRLVQEISRGKSAAITLLQEQTAKEIQERVDEAVIARDDVWQNKMSDQEMANQEILVNKEKDLQSKAARLQDESQKLIAEKEHALRVMLQESKGALKEKEQNMQLAMEERDLVKMATLSKQDAVQDRLQAQIDDLHKEKQELETLVHQMQEENEDLKNRYDKQLKERIASSEKQIAQLRIEHEQYVAELLTEHEKSIQEKNNKLIDKHAQHVAKLVRKHEDSSQSSNADLEKYYTTEMKKMKTNMERLLHEKNQQTETLNLTIQHLRTDLATNKQEFEQRSIEFKVKMEESSESYKEQISECDNLQKELDNVREEYEINKSQMEKELSLFRQNVQTISESLSCVQTENTDLKANLDKLSDSNSLFETENSEQKAKLDMLSESHSSVETESSELKCQLERLNKEVDEKYQSADSKVKELLGQVTEFETKQMDLSQERQKLLDANNECVKQIQNMDKTISEKDAQIDQLQKSISEVTTEMDRINTEKHESVIEKEHVINLNSENEDRLRTIETEKVELIQRVSSLETETQNSCSVVDELNRSLSVKETVFLEEKQSLTDQINILQKELDRNSEELQKKIIVLTEREEEIRKLTISCEEHVEANTELQQKTSTLENQLGLLQTNIQQTDSELKQSKEKFNQLRTEAKNRIKELKDKHIEELAEQEQTLSNKLDKLSDSNSLFETENSEQKAKLDMLSESHSSVETENSELKCQLERLNKEVDEKYQSADSKVKELLGQVTEFETKQMDLSQERQKLLDANNERVKQIQNMDKTISEKDAQIDQLQKSISEVTTEIDRINTENHESVIEKEHVINLNSENEDRLRTIETEKVELIQRVSSLETETQNSCSVVDELNRSLSVKETGFLEEKQSLTYQINILQKELDRNSEELQKKILVLTEREEEILTLKISCDEHVEANTELQQKTSTLENQLGLLQTNISQTDSELKQSMEKFNQLRTEAKNRIKELKDKHIEELAEQEQTWSNKLQVLEEQIRDELENKKALEESFKIQFQEKQSKFKDTCNKIKESFQTKLKERDEDYEAKLADLIRQKDISADDVTKNLENVQKQQATELRENHADEIMSLTTKFEEQVEKHKETYENDISALRSQCDILRNELEANRTEFESERARLLTQQEHNESELRKSFAETIDSLQVQLSEIHSEHEESTSFCSQLNIEKENIQKQFKLTVADHLTTIAEHENRSEQVSRKMLNLSEKHEIEIQEKDLVIANISARVSDLENTNTSMEEMLKAVNTQCQDKDDTILALSEENKNIQQLENECVTKIHLLENSVKELEGVCSDQANEIETIHDEAAKNIKNLREEYENKLVDMSSSDEELHVHLKVLNEKLSDTEKKLHDCIQDYESQIVEYKNKLDRQGRSLSEEKEVLASQLFEMTTQSHKRTEELQLALDSKMTESDDHRKEFVSNVKELEGKIEKNETILSEKSNQLSEMEGIIQERETQVTDLETELKENQDEKTKVNNSVIILEKYVEQLQEDHASQITTIENNWQSKANELKQKFLNKLKEVQSHGEEKVNVFKETLRQERAGSEERVSTLQGNLKEEVVKAEEMSSELAHANTKLLQLDQNKETIMELDLRIKSLEELVGEKDALVKEYIEKCKQIEVTLNSAKRDVAEKSEFIKELQANMHTTVSELESERKELDIELQLAKESLSKSESTNLVEKESLHSEIEKLNGELIESKSELSTLTDLLTANKTSIGEHIQKSKNVETELTQKVVSYDRESIEKTKQLNVLEEQLESASSKHQDSLQSIQKYQAEIVELTTEKESLKSAIETLETKTSALSNELETSVSELTGSGNVISDLQTTSNKQLEEKSELQQKCRDLEDKISNMASDLLKAKDANVTLEANQSLKLKEIKEIHEKEKEEIKSKFEAESATKVAEFKKKAELYISQIKKQVQGEKDTSESEYKNTISDLRTTIIALEQNIDQLKSDKENITIHFEKEKMEIEQRFRDQIDSKEKLEQAHLQKSESSTNFIEQLKLSLGKEKTEKENLNSTIQKLSQEKCEMENKVSDLEKKYKTDVNKLESEFQDMKIDKDEEIETLEAKVKEECDKLSKHYQSLLQTKDNDHMSKIKELMKEFNQKFSAKEKEYESSFSAIIEKSNREELSSQREMQQLLSEARGEISERDDKLDEVRMEYEGKLKERDLTLQSQAADHQRQVVDLKQRHEIAIIELQETQSRSSEHSEVMRREEVSALTQEWKVERQSVMPLSSAAPPPTDAQELLRYNQLTMDAVQSGYGAGDLGHQVLVLTKEIDNLKEKHRWEMAEVRGQNEAHKTFLPQPLIAAPDGATTDPNHLDNQYLEVQPVSLQARVAQLEGQLAQSRLREKDMLNPSYTNSYGSYGSPPSPGYYTDGTPSGPLLTEPTQLEYLRNILYMYMMGKERKTLCKVIGTVVHFSEDQMKQLLAREDSAINWLT